MQIKKTYCLITVSKFTNMQKVVLSLVVILSFFYASEAQVSEMTKTMSLGTQNALITSIPDADGKLIEKLWKDYIGEFGKVKKNRKSKEYYSDNIKISSISGAGTLDVYATTQDGQLITYFDMGNGFLSEETHGEAYAAATIFLTEFGHDVKRHMISEEIEDQEKELKSLDRELERLLSKNEGYHKDIERAKEKIAQAEANIEQNLIDQENKRLEIHSQNESIDETRERLENVGKEE